MAAATHSFGERVSNDYYKATGGASGWGIVTLPPTTGPCHCLWPFIIVYMHVHARAHQPQCSAKQGQYSAKQGQYSAHTCAPPIHMYTHM